MNTDDFFDVEIQHEIDQALGDGSLMDWVDPKIGPSADGSTPLRRGKVTAVSGDDILVDLGGKSAGLLSVKQMGDEPVPQVGDTIEVMVVSYKQDEGLLILSRQDAVTVATWDTIKIGCIAEGRVTGMNKGGLEMVFGGIKAFMPLSQVDRVFEHDASVHLNKRLRCKVLEIRRKEKTLIVSRRALLEEEAAVAREAVFASLTEGQIVQGTVKSIMPYGAFVDVGGADGLLHIGDMGYGRVENPRAIVTEGQQVEVKVLKVDRENQKIALGLKQIMADPWIGATMKYPADSIVSGTVTRLVDFGAFVELEPGVEGLIPLSEMSYEHRVRNPKELADQGQVVQLRVLSVDETRRRISLSLKRMTEDPWMGASVRWPTNTVVDGTIKRITEFGAFVELAPGVEGLVHISEISDARINNIREAVQEGQTVSLKVLGVDEDKRRISLSIKQARYASDSVSANPDASRSESEKPKPKSKRKKPLKGGLDR